jgi:hypothetical protein
MRTAPLVVRRDGAEFSLRRISDNELNRLARRAVPIEDDLLFWMHWNSRHRQPRSLSLPEFFVAMATAFGASGFAFDDYKSSFCFPFHLTTDKSGIRGEYVLLVQDWKGGVEAKLMRCFGESRAQLGPLHPFVDAELSRDEFRYVMNFLSGYLEARQEAALTDGSPTVPDFVQRVDAALLLYGYRDGAPFEHSHENQGDYDQALAQTPKALLGVDLGPTL